MGTRAGVYRNGMHNGHCWPATCSETFAYMPFLSMQADGFAVGLGKGEQLRSALLKMQKENKSSMSVDPLYSAYHYSHPPLEERLAAIDKAMLLVAKPKVQ